MDLIQSISGNAFSSFFQRSVENNWTHILAWELESLPRVLNDDRVKVTLCVPVCAHYAYTPCISVPGSLFLRSWWELSTTVAWGPGMCNPLVCVLCWSFTKSAWSCLLLPLSSMFENSDYICWFYKGIVSSRVLHKVMAVLLREHTKTRSIAQPSTRKKMRPRLGNISNAAVGHQSATVRGGC